MFPAAAAQVVEPVVVRRRPVHCIPPARQIVRVNETEPPPSTSDKEPAGDDRTAPPAASISSGGKPKPSSNKENAARAPA